MNDLLIFDLETKNYAEQVEGGWDNIAGMGFGTACIYSYNNDEYFFFMPHERDTCKLMLEGNDVISFNGKRFDNFVVLENNTPEKVPWNDIDLFEEIVNVKFKVKSVEEAFGKLGKATVLNGSISLDKVCRATTIGCVKRGKGRDAPDLIRKKWWSTIFGYNLRDVRLTRRLFESIVKNGICIDGHGNEIELVNMFKWKSVLERYGKLP